MAKTFETDSDKEEQEKVLAWIESTGRQIMRTRQFATVDAYVCKDGVILSALEVKRRYIDREQEQPFKISVKKIENCKRLAESLNTELYLAVQWNDCLGILNIKRGQTFYREAGGRPPREGSANDWEVMYHIPHGLFTIYDKKAD